MSVALTARIRFLRVKIWLAFTVLICCDIIPENIADSLSNHVTDLEIKEAVFAGAVFAGMVTLLNFTNLLGRLLDL